jgi:Domain of unknown function (DUF4214)
MSPRSHRSRESGHKPGSAYRPTQTLLGRQPDAAGLAGWVHSMASGTAFQQIQPGFLTSTEYQARALRRFP